MNGTQLFTQRIEDYLQYTGPASIKISDISDLTLQDPISCQVKKMKAICITGIDKNHKSSEFNNMLKNHQFAQAYLENGVFKKILMHKTWVEELKTSGVTEIAFRYNNGIKVLSETVDFEVITQEKYEKLILSNKLLEKKKTCIVS
jgi:hypothetical protein